VFRIYFVFSFKFFFIQCVSIDGDAIARFFSRRIFFLAFPDVHFEDVEFGFILAH
jgi:hypothetical protein